jgi:hypothetical protein
VLIDFGVVKQAAPHWYEVSTINPDGSVEASVSVGKLGYAPYEQIRIGQCSPRSDLYALAVTAAVLLTARPPNSLIDPKSLEWTWQSLVTVHPQFARILERMMAEKPQDRYPSARLVLEDLEALSQHFGIEPSDRTWFNLGSASHQIGTLKPGTATLLPGSLPGNHLSKLEPTLLEVVPRSAYSSSKAVGSRTAKVQSRVARQSADLISRASIAVNSRQRTIRTQKQATTLKLAEPSHPTLRPLADIPATNLKILSQPQARFSLKTVLMLSLLALVPLGITVGVQSPYINALCQSLDNCAEEQPLRTYHRVVLQAKQAKMLAEQSRTLANLQYARDRLANAIDRLAALPTPGSGSTFVSTSVQRELSGYRDVLQRLDQRLEKETRANTLLQRATTEARAAEHQTRIAKTQPQLSTARSQWRRALATLSAIPTSSFVAEQATTRSQEYTTHLQTVEQRLAAIRPPGNPLGNATLAASAKPAVLPPPEPVSLATPTLPSPVAPVPAAQPTATDAPQGVGSKPRSSPQPDPQSNPQSSVQSATQPTAQPAAQPATQSTLSSPTAIAAAAPAPPPSPISRVPINQSQPTPSNSSSPNRFLSNQINQILTAMTPSTTPANPGTVDLTASTTLNQVSIRLDGARVSSRGTFVANLQVENQSDRPFGFVPLFAEVRDASGQSVPARLRLSDGSEDGMVNPGEQLKGEVYLLDRPWNNSGSQNLTLVIREGTSGNRNFYVDF